MSNIELTVKTPDWDLEAHHLQHVLHNQSLSKLGWQRFVLIAKNDAAERFLKDQGMIMLRQNDHLQGVPLCHDDPKKASLVFYRHNPLNKITLDYVFAANANTQGEETLHFSVRVKPISAAKAWFFMLQAVSKKDKQNGLGAAHIYRITRARQKRKGGEHALRKLVQAYQPLLQYQLISCEPYNYWRLHNEPLMREALLKSYKPGMSLTVHSLNEDTQPSDIIRDHWYYWRTDDFVYTRQFEQLLQASVSKAEKHRARLVYWDHDQLSAAGDRVRPQFKPGWNPELLMSKDYIDACYAVKGELLLNADPQLLMVADSYTRLLKLLSLGDEPYHVPVILQHHKGPSESTTSGNANELEQQRQQALKEWLLSQGEQPRTIESVVEPGIRKVSFHVPQAIPEKPLISIIVPTRDGLDITQNCIDSVLSKTQFRGFEIIIVNNQSEQAETLNWFQQITQHPQVRVVDYDAPFNYSAINNYAAQQARGNYLCFLNNDTEVITDNWLDELLQHAQRPAIGCVGAKLYYPDNTIQHAGVILGVWGLAGHAHKNFTRHSSGYSQRLLCVQNFSAVTAACLMIKRDRFEAVNGFNENELTVAFNDVDLCLKVQAAGYRNVWTPFAELYHYESKSRGKEDSPEKKAREQREIQYMKSTWSKQLAHDPAYNPNLTRVQEDFGINLDRWSRQ